MQRLCRICGIEKPTTEFAYRTSTYCRSCAKDPRLAEENYKKHLEQTRRSLQKHRERYREQRREYQRIYHREHIKEYREYAKSHRCLINIAHTKSHLKRLGVEGSFTGIEFFELCEKCNWKCAYCGREVYPQTVTMDHVIPLSRGGTNYISNITPACWTCNNAKRARTPEEWGGP